MLARDRGTIERPGDEAAELHARRRTRTPATSEQTLAAATRIVFGLLQVELEHAPRPARHDL